MIRAEIHYEDRVMECKWHPGDMESWRLKFCHKADWRTADVYLFREFHRVIWTIADEFRSIVDEWNFKNYVLGTMFYRYIVGI